jgi:hypothetical protein
VIARSIRLLIVAAALTASGCTWLSKIYSRDPFSPKSPCALPPEASKEELVSYLNKNILADGGRAGLTSWRSRAKVRAKAMPVGVDAEIALSAPRNLRLRVYEPLSNNALMDMGSNDQQFWLWSKEQKQEVVTCHHEDFATAITELRMPLPFHPDWMMEVFGVVPYDPSEFKVEHPFEKGPLVDLVAQRFGPNGEPVSRVIRIDACHGIVREHQLRRQDGSVIARALLSNHFKEPTSQLIVAKQVRLEWPDLDEFIVLTFHEIDVNPQMAEESSLWTVPSPPGSQLVDLGDIARERGRQMAERDPGLEQAGASSAASATGGESEAPAWSGESTDASPNPNVGLSIESADWQAPEERAGRVGPDEMEFESPEPADSSSASPWPDEPTIRMQSSDMEPAAKRPSRSRFFNWLFPKRKSATAPPAAYSSEASRSSSGRPRLGLE